MDVYNFYVLFLFVDKDPISKTKTNSLGLLTGGRLILNFMEALITSQPFNISVRILGVPKMC
jgi:hypothetical protein